MNARAKGVKRVLVVDDDPPVADTLALILRHAGFEALVSYDARTAIRQFESAAPEVVISDVMMPGMTGIEMAVWIRERHPDCKIMLMSGVAPMVDLLGDVRGKGYDFELLAKPIHPAELLNRIAARATSAVANPGPVR